MLVYKVRYNDGATYLKTTDRLTAVRILAKVIQCGCYLTVEKK